MCKYFHACAHVLQPSVFARSERAISKIPAAEEATCEPAGENSSLVPIHITFYDANNIYPLAYLWHVAIERKKRCQNITYIFPMSFANLTEKSQSQKYT